MDPKNISSVSPEQHQELLEGIAENRAGSNGPLLTKRQYVVIARVLFRLLNVDMRKLL